VGEPLKRSVGSLLTHMNFIGNIVPNATCRLAVAFGVVILCAISSIPQNSDPNVNGRWIWKEIAHKNKTQTRFRILIHREGNLLRGTYSVDEFLNGEWQGEDGNQTPFVGRVNRNDMKIEFDPQATQPGYEKNVSYTAPADGRKPSIATITWSGPNLRWRLIRGPGIQGVPAAVILRLERRSDRTR
jgi:hypothetical protein